MNHSTRLIQLRKKIGLSQKELAAEFGVTPGALSYWESGKRPVPEMALRLIEIYEEFIDDDLALKRHEDVIRTLAAGWTKRLMLSFASGARKQHRQRIQEGLETSLYNWSKYELSPHRAKRSLQVSVLDRMVAVASKSKGLPMKLVQTMTFLNPSMRQEAREALEQIHKLQCPMAPTLVAKILAEELGQSPSKLFAEWSPKPFATASIGQVHQARLKTGERVAVKVQYPDIQASLESDLASLGFFAELISIFNPEGQAIIEKLQKTILKEADYYREKDSLDTFHEMFAGFPNVITPKTYAKYCSPKVLTMDYVEGKTLQEFRSASYEERKTAAETLAVFMTVTVFKAGLMNTDTHSGNFIFCPGGKVGFIDFGRSANVELKGADKLLKAVIGKDAETARTLLPQMFPTKKGTAGEMSDESFEKIWEFFLSQQAHLHVGEFRFTREYIAKAMSEGKNFSQKQSMTLSMDAVWSLATSMGLWNVLADLDVAVDYGKLSMRVLSNSFHSRIPSQR